MPSAAFDLSWRQYANSVLILSVPIIPAIFSDACLRPLKHANSSLRISFPIPLDYLKRLFAVRFVYWLLWCLVQVNYFLFVLGMYLCLTKIFVTRL